MTVSLFDDAVAVPSVKVDDFAASPALVEGTVNLPYTPPRGRTASRYPASLAKGDIGRIPLHRRGTSKTYERLEDLLREAGYKETRVFTPESERREAEGDMERRSSVRGGVDTVVGYLASWMPGAGRSAGTASPQQAHQAPSYPQANWSLPSSPLAHKRSLHSHHDGIIQAPSPLSLSPSASATTIASTRSLTSNSSVSEGNTVSHMRVMQSQPHGVRPQSSASGNLRTYAQVSAAQGYLRHMASAPNMPKHISASGARSVSRALTHDALPLPALPSRWLDTVTKAVAGSGHPRAYVGGPQSVRYASRPSSRMKRESKFTLGVNGPSTYGAGRSASGVPPGLMTYLSPAETAPSAVSTARVMCRSALSSRSASRMGERTSCRSLRAQRRSDASSKGGAKARGRGDGVPMLASTCVENDAWSTHWVDGRRVHLPYDASQDQDDTSLSDTHHEDNADDTDDDEDGELDFARLLVPPKRQYSIQSLRRHIHHSRANLREHRDMWDDEDDYGTRSQSRRSSLDEGETHGWEAMGVPGFGQGTTKRRRGLPRGWAHLAVRS